MAAPLVTTTTFSVWDGSWALLEEYGPGNVLSETYLQGAHGLVKTMVANIYYYQDELGSTSHIASSAGALLESYRYDLYGKPTYWNPSGVQITASTRNVRDLFTGQRWVPEIGLYDDRNRFMSPDLGRFLQPDPIGFKGDGSNLYRYCHNDWANRSDPMGTTESYTRAMKTIGTGDQNRNPDSGARLGAQSAWDRHSSFYARATKADHVEAGSSQNASSQKVTITGQNVGSTNPRKAPAGDPKSSDAPDGLQPLEKIPKGYYDFYPLQLTRHGIFLKEKGSYAVENLGDPKVTGNLGVTQQSTSGLAINMTKGVLLDRVGPTQPPSSKANGTSVVHQVYSSVVYKGLTYPIHVAFDQVTNIQNGVVTTQLISSH